MTRIAALRLGWAMLALPLAGIASVAIAATFPSVLSNSALRLLLIAYVILLPILPIGWSGKRSAVLVVLALATIAAQVTAFGIVNYWF